jgi:cyclopropane fatty-acyl-phospholipid synthase-like methyltransferase
MQSIYKDGTYLEKNPLWHEEHAPWKSRQIIKLLERNDLKPSTICEIGCGSGEILNRLSAKYPENKFFGYDISPQAIAICEKKAKNNLSFHLESMYDNDHHFDIVMAIDVFEHVEDYFAFLRKMRTRGEFKIFHIPLDLSVQTLLRTTPILSNRKAFGHIHYFSKELALEALADTGYAIVDSCYTSYAMDLHDNSWKSSLLKFPRRVAFSIHQDLAVRILGGFSLLVLAR